MCSRRLLLPTGWHTGSIACRLSCALVFVLVAAGGAGAQLQPVACLDAVSPVEFPDSQILAIAPDGSTMVGELIRNTAPFRIPFVWRRNADGVFEGEVFPIPPELLSLTLRGVSNEGRVLVGSATFVNPTSGPRQAFRWTEATDFEYFESGFDQGSDGFDVSADGEKVVGSYTYLVESGECIEGQQALSGFVWQGAGFTELTGRVSVEIPPPQPEEGIFGTTIPVSVAEYPRAGAVSISGDGNIVVGTISTVVKALREFELNPGTFTCSGSGSGATEAAFWSGAVANLLDAPGADCPLANDRFRRPESIGKGVSRDGTVIVGSLNENCVSNDVKWLTGAGPIPIQVSEERISAAHVAEDGSVVAKVGSDFFVFEGQAPGRRLDDVLIEDFCVDLVGNIIDVTDLTNLESGGLIVFYAKDDPQSPLTQRFLTLPCRDPDQDGLCTEWEEMGGIDLDGDGMIQPPPAGGDLVIAGADPMHKDVYIEIDELLLANNVSQDALNDVVNAFARVPNALIGNPDRNPGINLHFEVDEIGLELPGGRTEWLTDNVECNQNSDVYTLRAMHFGTVDERTDPDVVAAKAEFYRYLIFGGIGRSHAEPFGNDLFVALSDNDPPDGTREDQATVIMHELGHTFGLRHGGSEHTNNKPNYHSLMNYTWEHRGRETIDSTMGQQAYANSWVLDYSRRPFRTLFEFSLLETDGIGGDLSHWVPAGPLRICAIESGLCARLVNEVLPVDWDENGMIDLDPVGPVNANLTRPVRPGEPANLASDTLLAAEDWPTVANLYEDFRHPNWGSGVSGSSCLDFSDTVEEGVEGLIDLTEQEADVLRDQPLVIDCNGNGVADDDELTAGTDTDSDGNGVLDGCQPLFGDVDLDGDVDEDDRLLLIDSFGRGDGEDEYIQTADLDGDRTVTFIDYQAWVGGASNPAGQATVRFEPADLQAVPGEIVSVDLVADIAAPVFGFGLDLALDLSTVGLMDAPEIGPAWLPAFATDGDALVGVGPVGGVSGKGVLLARLTLQAGQPGDTLVEPSDTETDPAEGMALVHTGFAQVSYENLSISVVPEPAPVAAHWLALLIVRSLARRRRLRTRARRSRAAGMD